jgi:hypothetical protein
MEIPWKVPEENKKKEEIVPQSQYQPQPKPYTDEYIDALIEKRIQEQEQRRREDSRNEDDDGGPSIINSKLVRQLKDTVAVFTALKDLSSNPLQKSIEDKVGGMAATVVESAFNPRGPPPKQDILDKILNSQFAHGLGSGLGQRAPELVETMGRTFGTEKTGQIVDGIIGKYGTTGGQSGPRQTYTGPHGSPPEQKADKQSDKELLLSLDPNNPEHVSAYAGTQGGLPVDVARKMLIIHQDAFIEQLKRDGMNVTEFEKKRNERSQSANEEDIVLKLKQDQAEMLRLQKQVEQLQLQQENNRIRQQDQGKVIPYKDIQKGNINEEIIIPDKWDEGMLSDAETEAIKKAEAIARVESAKQWNKKGDKKVEVIEPKVIENIEVENVENVEKKAVGEQGEPTGGAGLSAKVEAEKVEDPKVEAEKKVAEEQLIPTEVGRVHIINKRKLKPSFGKK